MAKSRPIRYPQSPLSADREAFITRQTELHNSRIDRAQTKLWALLRDGILAGLVTDEGGSIVRQANDPFLAAKIDEMYASFTGEHLQPIAAKLGQGFETLAKKNAAYFQSIKPNEADDQVKASVFSTLGITGGAIAAGSILLQILQDRDAVNAIKSTILSAVFSGVTLTALKIAVEEIITKQDGGILRRIFEKKAPDPFVRVDRFIGNKYATTLELKYAIYQGGLIGTSRPFCRERNNRVFSRDEIARFGTPADEYGGYENKTTGDFQGKPKQGYNPFTDCGGYHCRHQLDWISDELAAALRPNLRP